MVIGIIFLISMVGIYLIVQLTTDNKTDTTTIQVNQLNEEIDMLKQDLENMIDENEELKLKIKDDQQEFTFIEGYNGLKYPGSSGLRRYIGEEPLRIYPNSKAPYNMEYKPLVVELINEVISGEETWCLVLDSNGVSGYVERNNLITISEEDEDFYYNYGSTIETIGGFGIGDRIEKIIGTLNRDYYLAYENGRIYEFPENNNQREESNEYHLSAGVGNTNIVQSLMTNSSEFQLKDDYKVGDNAKNTLEFYESKYDYVNEEEFGYHINESTFIFTISPKQFLQFKINSERLNSDSIISRISLFSYN